MQQFKPLSNPTKKDCFYTSNPVNYTFEYPRKQDSFSVFLSYNYDISKVSYMHIS